MRTLLVFLLTLPAAAQDMGLPPGEAARRMTVPPGFKVTLFAGEPDVRQPNAMCIDDRGRIWVAENYSYTGPGGPWKPSGRDRILIFEDKDGDGKFDERKVFHDKLSFISGLEIGFGGVWVGSPPNLLFIPDKDGDDVPDGEPRAVLDGWGYHDQHETLNSFIWGPDGWLYGNQGVFTHSRVGKPGCADAERVPCNAAYWRYHPLKDRFEVFAEGTSNPWGMDFDDHGQAFAEACVIPHFWHVIQGARYQRQGGKHFNPHTYEDIKTIADHKHEGLKGRKGGHAHGGFRIYLGDSFPADYRGKAILGTIHHHGMYVDAMERKGSGFVAKHGDDFLMANDPFYLGFNHDYGPDGAITVIDWYDPRACHGQTPAHIETGRIYKITYGDPKKVTIDLGKLTSAELVKLQLHPNDWQVRHARRLLQERGPDPAVHAALKEVLERNPEVPRKLRALWALHATGGAPEALLTGLLKHENEYLRAWAIQLLAEDGKVADAVRATWTAMAKDDPSPVVRLYLCSALQRIAPELRWETLEALAAHAEDVEDHNLPLMIWYAAEPCIPLDAAKATKLLATSKIPKLRQFIPRRMASGAGAPKAAPAKSVPKDGLVLHLKPEGADWKDLSDKPLSISAQGGPAVAEAGKRPAIALDGRDDVLVVPHQDSLVFRSNDSFTIGAWIHLAALPPSGWRGIVTKSRDAAPWYGIWIDDGGHWNFGGPQNVQGSAATTGWTHVCAVQERGGARRLYVNGAEAATGSPQDALGKGDLWIGGAKTTKEFTPCGIGEVRIYRRALDASEVAYLALNP